MSSVVLRASRDGDVQALRAALDQHNDQIAELVEARDEEGLGLLALAARAGHAEVVKELLARGADRSQVLEHQFGKDHAEVGPLLFAPQEGAETAPLEGGQEGGQEPYLVDIHGGQQMPNGAISYVNAMPGMYAQQHGGFVPQAPIPYHEMGPYGGPHGAHQPPQGFYAEGPIAHYGPFYGHPAPFRAPHGAGQPVHLGGNGKPIGEHGRKDSSTNLPPPDVARSIPCRNFPNCRFGDKCAFAHPVGMPMGMTPMAPPPLAPGPLSPSVLPAGITPGEAEQHGLYYQQPVPYGYPGYPQPGFYPAPPGPHHLHYPPAGMAMPLQLPPVLPNGPPAGEADGPGPVVASEPSQQASSATLLAANGDTAQTSEDVSSSPVAQATEDPSGGAESSVSPNETSQTAGEVAAPSASPAAGEDSPVDPQGRPQHRRQSFNSFLHSHAVPFQPSGHAAPMVDANGIPTGVHGHFAAGPSNYRGKARRGGGSFGAPRSFRENRPPCTFFPQGRCRYGDKCAFPHILPDGGDARAAEGHFGQRSLPPQAPPVRLPKHGRTSPSTSTLPPAPIATTSVPALPNVPSGPQKKPFVKPNGIPGSSVADDAGAAQSDAIAGPSTTSQAPPTRPTGPKAGVNGSKAGPNGKGNGGPGQRANGSAGSAKRAPAQKLPNANDFPALPFSPNPQQMQTGSPPAQNGSAAAKVNFSTVLSAPAPPKAAPQVSEQTAAPATSNGHADEKSDKSRGGKGQSEKKQQQKSTAGPNGATNAKAVQPNGSVSDAQLDDGFTLVGRRAAATAATANGPTQITSPAAGPVPAANNVPDNLSTADNLAAPLTAVGA